MELKYGLLIEEFNLQPRDWRMGGVTGTIKSVLREDGDYRSFLPSPEYQIGLYFDTLACVTFSAMNNLEIIANVMGIEMNRSDRFTAKMSGTTKEGNSLNNVAQSIRIQGTVDETEWSYPRLQRTPVYDWDDFYADIPQEIQDLGIEWLKDWEIQHEWVDMSDVREALKYGPLQVGVYAWTKIRPDGMYDDGGKTKRNHAVTLVYACDEYYEIFDHYDQLRKKLVPTYDFKWLKQFNLKKKTDTMPTIVIPNDTFCQLVEGIGGFGLYVDGKMYVQTVHEVLDTQGNVIYINNLAELLSSAAIRGALDKPRKTLTQEQWDSFVKYNLKNEQV